MAKQDERLSKPLSLRLRERCRVSSTPSLPVRFKKEAWHQAGIPFIGHTELLADRTKTSDYCMMLTSDSISCVLCTVHLPLADVAQTLSIESIERAIELGAGALQKRLGRPARVGVLGLNPHAA